MRFTKATVKLLVASSLVAVSWCFQPLSRRSASSPTSQLSQLSYCYGGDNSFADPMESFVGGPRYEFVPLPDSMMDTTLYVGNLCEFCKDRDLSELFQVVSQVQSVPACVARKANMSSLKYGFVTFLTVEEKEAAILRFHGSSFQGKSLKVEPIRDHPKMGRVKVPEQIVSYVLGQAKPKTRHYNNRKSNSSVTSLRSISRPTVDDSRGSKKAMRKKKISNRKDGKETKSPLSSRRERVYKLNKIQQDELLRAARRGYLTLTGKGSIRDRSTNSLACSHRQFCDEKNRPQIVLCKGKGRDSPLDYLIVDFSPLRLQPDFLDNYKIQVVSASVSAGLNLRRDYREDNCNRLELLDDCTSDDMDEGISEYLRQYELDNGGSVDSSISDINESITSEMISHLPVMSVGVFEGGRSKAKLMAKELAELWDIPVEPLDYEESTVPAKYTADTKKIRGSKARRHRKNENRKRRRNDQRYLDMRFC